MRRPPVQLGATFQRHCANLLVISGHDDSVNLRHLFGNIDGPGDQRLSAKIANVLSRNRFAAAPRGDDCNDSLLIHHFRYAARLFISLGPRSKPAKTVDCLPILGPLARIDPSVLSNGENANAPSSVLDGSDE